jgi:hypothetical protein
MFPMMAGRQGLDFRGDTLERVLIQTERWPQDPLFIQAVELYTDGVVVRWWGKPGWWRKPLGSRVSFTLSDDVATPYRKVSGGARENGRVARGEVCFVPCVPDSATALRIVRQDEDDWQTSTDGDPPHPTSTHAEPSDALSVAIR